MPDLEERGIDDLHSRGLDSLYARAIDDLYERDFDELYERDLDDLDLHGLTPGLYKRMNSALPGAMCSLRLDEICTSSRITVLGVNGGTIILINQVDGFTTGIYAHPYNFPRLVQQAAQEYRARSATVRAVEIIAPSDVEVEEAKKALLDAFDDFLFPTRNLPAPPPPGRGISSQTYRVDMRPVTGSRTITKDQPLLKAKIQWVEHPGRSDGLPPPIRAPYVPPTISSAEPPNMQPPARKLRPIDAPSWANKGGPGRPRWRSRSLDDLYARDFDDLDELYGRDLDDLYERDFDELCARNFDGLYERDLDDIYKREISDLYRRVLPVKTPIDDPPFREKRPRLDKTLVEMIGGPSPSSSRPQSPDLPFWKPASRDPTPPNNELLEGNLQQRTFKSV
jgi:hypothetical protein